MVLELLQDAQLRFQKKCFGDNQKKVGTFQKRSRIAPGRLVKFLEKKFLRQEKKSEYFPKMVLELLQDTQLSLQKKCFGDKQKIKMNTQNEKQIQ